MAGATFYLWLANVFSLQLILHATHDDALFLRLASALARGKWLSRYDQLILIKGMGYPAFVALVYRLGLPLLLAQHLLYVLACAVFCYAVRDLLERAGLRALLFLMLLFNPTTWLLPRVIRDHFYMSLTLLLLACAAGALNALRAPLRELAAWTSGAGLALAALWHTREEGLWLVPMWLCWMLCASLAVWQARRERRQRLGLILATPLFPLACGLLIATLNFAVYGTFTTTELTGGAFAAAFGATLRVTQQQPQRYLPMPAETRERLYRVSPAFAELRTFFEGPGGQAWKDFCLAGLTPCGQEFVGGWYLFAFREAVSSRGYYNSAPQAQAYYERLAAEVNRACASGALACGPPRQTVAPPVRREDVTYIIQSWRRAFVFLARFELPAPLGFSQTRSYCQGRTGLVPVRDAIYPCFGFEDMNQTRISGWAISEVGEIEFEARTLTGQPVALAELVREDSPDIVTHAARLGLQTPRAARARFRLKLNTLDEARLVMKCAGREVAVINTSTGQVLQQAERVYLNIDAADHMTLPNRQTAPAISFRLRSLDWLQRVYQTFFPGLAGAALVLLPWLCWRVRRDPDKRAFAVLGLMCLLALLTRLSLLALIDATSFLAININYLAPVYPILIGFCGLTLGGLFEQYRPRGLTATPICGETGSGIEI